MSTDANFQGMSGRAASMARRRALSQGKAGLPAASERVRSGFRDAAMPTDTPAAPAPMAAHEPDTAPSAPVSAPLPPVHVPSGREASVARRKALSAGKGGLPPAKERVRSGFREAAMPNDTDTATPHVAAATPATPAPAASAAFGSGREASIARRKALSAGKGGLPPAQERVRSGFREAAMPADVPSSQLAPAASGAPAPAAAQPARSPRRGELTHPPKVPSVTTAVSNATVTGLSYAAGRAMTGAEAGYDKPLTGTQYVGGAEGGYRASMGKVGHARTNAGLTVSGTMVRSTVRITGDEDSADVRITGNADQTVADDLDARPDSYVAVGAQFQRQSQPHGQSVFGSNLGRSARAVGSRSRDTERPVEQTLSGHAVSGTAIGRSVRVTGDEGGAARSLTGSQYLAPARDEMDPAPADGRSDPATGAKVTLSQTWGGQTVSGPMMEHDGRVTGSEHGTCAAMTGTPYYGATGAQDWCDPAQAEAEAARRAPRAPRAITGDVPLNDPTVSGTGRGADRAITGSAYFVQGETQPDAGAQDPVTQSIAGFSVSSPQRASHVRAREAAPEAAKPGGASAITGTFAQGDGKITGNVEFQAPSRGGQPCQRPAHGNITGEGATRGAAITGSGWSENSSVTGTEGYIATNRNPSQRAGSAQAFAGAKPFKSKAPTNDPVSPVTGATGGTPDSCAKVTVSGGAAG